MSTLKHLFGGCNFYSNLCDPNEQTSPKVIRGLSVHGCHALSKQDKVYWQEFVLGAFVAYNGFDLGHVLPI